MRLSLEQPIIIKFLTKENVKPSEICQKLERWLCEETLSDISVNKWSKASKNGRERVANEPHLRRVTPKHRQQ